MKLFGRQPAIALAVITSAVLLLGTLGFDWINGDQAGLIVAAITALGGAAMALFTRPIAPSAFTAAVGALAAVVTAYGLNLTPEQVAAINSVVISFLLFITYGQVSPIETPLTNASTNPVPEAGGGTVDEPVLEEAVTGP
jgi:hypothetical protein